MRMLGLGVVPHEASNTGGFGLISSMLHQLPRSLVFKVGKPEYAAYDPKVKRETKKTITISPTTCTGLFEYEVNP